MRKGSGPQKSSCHHRLGRIRCPWLDEDPCYQALGTTTMQRRRRHRAFLNAAILENEWTLIREAVFLDPLCRCQVEDAVDEPETVLDGRGCQPSSVGFPVLRQDRPVQGGDAR